MAQAVRVHGALCRLEGGHSVVNESRKVQRRVVPVGNPHQRRPIGGGDPISEKRAVFLPRKLRRINPVPRRGVLFQPVIAHGEGAPVFPGFKLRVGGERLVGLREQFRVGQGEKGREIFPRHHHLVMQLNRRHSVGIRNLRGDSKRLFRRRLTGGGCNLPDLRRGICGKDGVALAGSRAGRRRGRRRNEQHRVDRQVAAAQRRVDDMDGNDVVALFQEGAGVGQIDQLPLPLVVGDAAG